MTRTHLVSLIAVGGAGLVAWQLEGLAGWLGVNLASSAVGLLQVGVLAGALLGTAVALLGHALLQQTLTDDFEAALRSLLVAFGAKLFFLVAVWGLLAFVPAAARLADARAFALAYVFCAFAVLIVGALDHLRALQRPAEDTRTLPDGASAAGARTGESLS